MKERLKNTPKKKWGDAETEPKIIWVKPYNMKQICLMYDMSYKSMRSSLAPIKEDLGPRTSRIFTVHQVEKIFMHLGLPYAISEKQG